MSPSVSKLMPLYLVDPQCSTSNYREKKLLPSSECPSLRLPSWASYLKLSQTWKLLFCSLTLKFLPQTWDKSVSSKAHDYRHWCQVPIWIKVLILNHITLWKGWFIRSRFCFEGILYFPLKNTLTYLSLGCAAREKNHRTKWIGVIQQCDLQSELHFQ